MQRKTSCSWKLEVYLSILVATCCLLLSLTSPGLASSPEDQVRKVAVDAAGNVYVAGDSWNDSNHDFVTIKYSPAGDWLWGRRFNGPANGYDNVTGLAVDTEGNVIVTGRSWNGANDDYVTIKYDAAGNWVWGRRFNAPANGDDKPASLAVDTEGNVYVTGTSWGTSYDYVTIKYSSTGAWLWGQRYNGPANDWDIAHALAVDTSGNVYVTGDSDNNASVLYTNCDYVTIKYGPDGAWIWGRRYDSSFDSGDIPYALAIDEAGNVYVTGNSYTGANWDYVTIKYTAAGAWAWGQRYNSPTNTSDYASGLSVDAGGNVIVTGHSYDASYNGDYVTIKYSASGAWLWGRRYNGPANSDDQARALAVDASGNVLVTGWSYNSSNNDYVTIKYSSAGAWTWGQRYNSPFNGSDMAEALTLDASGNVYVTGTSWAGRGGDALDYDYVTIKYSASGAWIWGARYDGSD